jgi:FKBP-type peptidyl-prolyl cis-trans isomerase FkpA
MQGRRQFLWSTAVAIAAATATACGGDGDSDDSPTEPTPPPPTGPATMQVTEMTVGEGTEATAGRTVIMHYTLFRYDPAGADSKGAQIETSVGGNPLTFVVGATNIISGVSQGTLGMKVGGKRRIILPPSLAYGNTGSTDQFGRVIIRPNEWIIFELELLAVA